MALLDKFVAVSLYNGNEFTFTRISQTRFRRDAVLLKEGRYNLQVEYFTEGEIQRWLTDGKMTITNPATMDDVFKDRPLPATFFFTTLTGLRYTGYIHDDAVTVAWGDGVRRETTMYPVSSAAEYIMNGVWRVLPETWRSRNSAASEFMQFMQNFDGPLTTEDRVAICETIVFLNKVMYDEGESNATI